ncbi:MAG TPA: class I SAM-dependent RNA methyltransferase [Bryobacteraceae bacterium]|nr:class I SAM-dependent RNA methyltransferase [Bryobacteraceae bacterium]
MPLTRTPATVKIEKLVYGGDGLSRLDGQVVLTPFVLPGETVAVETAKAKTGLLRGSSPNILEPSEHRVVPRCEYFGVCGGCQYQHADYAYQLTQKVAILRETLQRLGGIVYDADIPVESGEPWKYRNRVQLHFAERKAGFHRQGSHALVAVDHCEIAEPLLVDAIARIQQAVKKPEWPGFLRSLELFTNGTDLQLNVLDSTKPVAARFFEWLKTILPGLAPGAIDYQAAGFRFRISGGSFFQVNRFLVDALAAEATGDTEGSHAVDLYAGVGLFSLPLAQRFAKVDAVERGLSATRDLAFNAGQSAGRVGVFRSSAESYIARLQQPPDLLLVDPPRAGLGKETTDALLALRPKRLTIVSCDPATLARDARALLAQYSIRRLALVDLFPQTFHFETVMHLDAS